MACAALAWIAAQCFWWLATPGSAAIATNASPTLMEQSHRVMARHFFDVAAAQQRSSEGASSLPPESIGARWRLLGTYVGPSTRSRAVFAMEGSSETVVTQLGERLSTGHEVVEVRPDGVVLSKDARRAELALRPVAPGAQEPTESRFGTAGPTLLIKDSR